ncbi:MAG: cytochrome c biogenesis protein [Coriobacteriia bacterium]|nr:cytochrome c biogenesis protein [Coriobacteriia bacterium]
MNRTKVARLILAVGGVLTTAAFFMTFYWANPSSFPDGRVDFAQKIFYFHVPVAEASFLVFFFTAFYSVRFLLTKDRRFDTRARIATEVTLFFVLLTMATGILWTKVAWGVWWQWEPRLTTYFIMTLLVIAYFVLRNSVEDEEKRAVYAAAFGILAFIDAPISFFITRWVESIHPVVLAGGESSGLETPMLVTFIVAQIGMLMLGYAFYQMRLHEEEIKERLEALKVTVGG